jgi:steroid delta-isomerase-like uncharacterized protein
MSVDALADGWEAAWSGRDRGAFGGVCAPDVHYEDPLTSRSLRGVEAVAAHAERAWAAFPDLRMERAAERLGDERFAAFAVRVYGTQVGDLDGLPPSGRFVTTHAVFWCELDADGRRLWRIRAFFDVHAAAVELGVLPRPGSLRERALLMLQGYGLRR